MAALSWVGVFPARWALPQMRKESPELDDMASINPTLVAVVLALVSFVYLSFWPFVLAWELQVSGLPQRRR
ncbi:hypothetical protein ACFWCA_19210 [Streptomyces phaeochromogenes]|uniref:hypothetical protein n=1 Tax=Streptomyces phaeochromogenes TaxID=1923 RepID=UPI0036BD698B